MALPSAIASVGSGDDGYLPPFKSSAGNFYIVTSTTSKAIDAYKATDPTSTWTVQDIANNPTLGDPNWTIITAVQQGDILHIATYQSAIDAAQEGYRYHTFDMSDDTWGVVAELIIAASDIGDVAFIWASIGIRSDGDVIVAYGAETDGVMGSPKQRVDYARREGTTWTASVALDAGGDVHYGNANCVLGTNDGFHFTWQRQTATTPDPPTAWSDLEGRTLDSANSLSTTETPSSGGTDTHLTSIRNMVSYDDAGTETINVIGAVTLGIIGITAVEDGSDNIDITGTQTEDWDTGGKAVGALAANHKSITGAELDGIIHVVYAGGGAGGADHDIYYSKSADNGATWDAPIELTDAITAFRISATIYERAGNTVLAFHYSHDSTQWYDEEDIGAGGGAISATAAMVFSAAANLDGDGKLDATPDPHLVFSATADLKAAGGAIAASPALVFAAATVNLEGLGKLDASPSMSISAFSAFLRVACDQELPPDAILVQTNLSGVVTDIDEPVDSPDGNWLLLS